MLHFLRNTMKKILTYFNIGEYLLWLSSVLSIILSYIFFDGNPLTFIASILGVTALIFCAKGNPIGQVLIVIFSLFYGYISYTFSYYGEMITYLGMSAPMAVWALISWLKNPYGNGHAEVRVNTVTTKEYAFLGVLAVLVTAIFCPVLYYLNTNNLVFSTISVTTSFIAVYLTARRSPYFAFAYALNDIALIVLWTWASFTDSSYIGVVICFVAFLANDLYSFTNWLKMQRRQATDNAENQLS